MFSRQAKTKKERRPKNAICLPEGEKWLAAILFKIILTVLPISWRKNITCFKIVFQVGLAEIIAGSSRKLK
jgi:hypothetical protein